MLVFNNVLWVPSLTFTWSAWSPSHCHPEDILNHPRSKQLPPDPWFGEDLQQLANITDADQARQGAPKGYRINYYEDEICCVDVESWNVAKQILETGHIFNLPWCRLIMSETTSLVPVKQHVKKIGENEKKDSSQIDPKLLIFFRVFPFTWVGNVNRLCRIEHPNNKANTAAISWKTTRNHLLKGAELVSLIYDSGGKRIRYRLLSYSRPSHLGAYFMFPYIVYLQRQFAQQSFRVLKAEMQRKK